MMEIEEIARFLPHRYPFLLVDRVVAVVPGESIRGYKNLTANENFFNGHFPGHPVMPGVLMIEALAQLAGILAFRTRGKSAADGVLFYLGGVDSVRFKRPVVPGDRLDMEAQILAEKRRVMKFSGRAWVEGELACSAEITCVEREA